jgi:hypothetical protein
MKLCTISVQVGLVSLLCAIPSFAGPLSICDAAAGNLVQNCGFETGDLTSWTQTPASEGSSFGVDSINPNSGFDEAFFGSSTVF